MTATLHSIFHAYISGLDEVDRFCSAAVEARQKADKTLEQRKDGLNDYSVSFDGLGALAFENSVDMNLSQSGHLLSKLTTVQTASNHTKRSIGQINDAYDHNHFLDPNLSVDDAYTYFGLNESDVVADLWHSGIDWMNSLGPDSLLDPKSSEDYVTSGVTQARDDFFTRLSRLYHTKKDEIDRTFRYANMNDPAVQAEKSQDDKDISSRYNAIVDSLTYQVVPRMTKHLYEWVLAIRGVTASYISSIAAAANLNAVSVGEILNLMTGPDGHNAPIMIWRTQNGGIIVGVNDTSKLTPQQVAEIIEQYLLANGMPANTPVTIVGYQNGGVIAQQTVQYVDAHRNKYAYNIAHVVTVGSKLVGDPQPGTSYDAYSFAGDSATGGGPLSLLPHDSVSWGGILASTAVSTLTGGPEETVPAFIENYAISVGQNIYSYEQQGGGAWQANQMDPGSGRQDYGHNYQGASKQWIMRPDGTYAEIQIVPDEPGAHQGALHIGSNPRNYPQSTYLDSVGIPDPRSPGLQRGQNGQVSAPPITQQPDGIGEPDPGTNNQQSLEGPLSAPTYYYPKSGS